MSKNYSWKISLFNLLFIVLAVSLVFVSRAEARSGCCSHHGGVCTYKCSDGVNVGYYCCDGTSLSSTCAPYYPSCSLSLPAPTSTNSTPAQTSTTETPKDIQETPTTPTAETQETQENNSSVLVWVISGIVIAGGIGWRYLSKKKASNVH